MSKIPATHLFLNPGDDDQLGIFGCEPAECEFGVLEAVMNHDSGTLCKTTPHQGTLGVHLLGLVDFDATLGLQEQQVYDLSGRDDLAGTLFFCEHPPVISMGREASRANLLLDDEELARRELKVRWVARGGGAICHAPGQLAIYLQLPLQRLGIGLAKYRTLFESAVVAACQELKIPAKRQADDTGIWTRGGQLGYFGACVKAWVSCQGMFLNISVDPRLLELTVSNASGARSASMQSLRLDPVRMPQVREALIRHIADNFGYAATDISTGHPLLRRTKQRVLIHA
ncbi:lipoyl(octanoyl) transferase LipB [Planctomicrobium piriforme]|uniref:Lipoyl(Octanoyl) transferase n=1 Tax=Planctomicrobium piriforme TaxID=1576369 RepID=A0A1I3BMX0_9PLAN|nr:hypothetical protein [Planctomicrobium piriforme]SFH63603.1 lipoyl(octanoyl) transferase [Planctomicrobium piriforme]